LRPQCNDTVLQELQLSELITRTYAIHDSAAAFADLKAGIRALAGLPFQHA
jgi:hypothetical protein